MPTLNWIGKDKVVNHHLDVPFYFGDIMNSVRNLRHIEFLFVKDSKSKDLGVDYNCVLWR